MEREGQISAIPPETIAWSTFDSIETMFPDSWSDIGLSPWELRCMPWWLEYPIGTYPPSEKDLYTREQQLKAKRARRGIVDQTSEPIIGSNSKVRRVHKSLRESRSKKRLDMDVGRGNGASEVHADVLDEQTHDSHTFNGAHEPDVGMAVASPDRGKHGE